MSGVPDYRVTPNPMKAAAGRLGCMLGMPHTSRRSRYRTDPGVILVVNNDTDTERFHELARRITAICLVRGRLQWVSTLQGQLACYFGRDLRGFRLEFGDFGVTAYNPLTVTQCPCGEPFVPPRSDGRYCSPACRQKAYRRRHSDGAS